MNFSEIGPAHTPEIEISKKYWTSFAEIGLYQRPGKLKFREKFWMSFPGYANKG